MVDLTVDTKPLKDYAVPTKEEAHCNIMYPPIAAKKFKLKPSLISTVQKDQFLRLPLGNMNLHHFIFVDNSVTLKTNGVDQNAIRLRLYSPCHCKIVHELGYNPCPQIR